VPAAAVITAPRVFTKAVAVKTLVVEFLHPVQSGGRWEASVQPFAARLTPGGGEVRSWSHPLFAPEKLFYPISVPSSLLDH